MKFYSHDRESRSGKELVPQNMPRGSPSTPSRRLPTGASGIVPPRLLSSDVVESAEDFSRPTNMRCLV